MTGVLMQCKNLDAEKHIYKGGHQVKTRVGIRVMFQEARNAGGGQQPPEAERPG